MELLLLETHDYMSWRASNVTSSCARRVESSRLDSGEQRLTNNPTRRMASAIPSVSMFATVQAEPSLLATRPVRMILNLRDSV